MNGVKYSSSTIENRVITKGDWYIATGDVPKGETEIAGYWTAYDPPGGWFAIYTPKDIGQSIRVARNYLECIGILKEYGYTGNDTIEDALLWSQSQDNILVIDHPVDPVITDNLLLYLDAYQISSYPLSGNTWYDLSLNKHTASLSGSTSHHINKMEFNGTSSYVSTSSFDQGKNDKLSFSFLLNSFDIINGTRTILSDANQNDSIGYINIYINNSNLVFEYAATTTSAKAEVPVSTIIPKTNIWYNVTITVDYTSKVINFYSDGVKVSTQSMQSTPVTPTTDRVKYIGSYDSSSNFFYGMLSSVMIYDGYLSDTQVTANYNALKDRFSFITTWQTTTPNETITLPLVSTGNYDFVVDWGDNSEFNSITGYNQSEITHTYSSPDIYKVKIRGRIEGFRFNNTGDKSKIKSIDNYGSLVITTNGSFYGCSNMTSMANDAPEITSTSLSNTFLNCLVFNGPIWNWDISGVDNLSSMFSSAKVFNQPIGTWDTSNVTNTTYMFYQASSFNQPIGDWDVSSVVNMNSMFLGSSSFNQPIGDWDVSSVSNMSGMFVNTSSFNRPIGSWNVSGVTIMDSMFAYLPIFDNGAPIFNQDISGWDINQVITFFNFMLDTNGLSTDNYDKLLIGWEGQTPQSNINITFGSSKYTAGSAAARQSLIDNYNWTITDGGTA